MKVVAALVVLGGIRPVSAQRPPLQFPSGLTLDSAGNVIVADRSAHVVFRIDARTNDITVIAGTGTPGRSGDGGPARAAQLRNPEWVEFDARGNLYVADRGNHVIRKIDGAGIITHVAGTGVSGQTGDGGPAATAAMTNPFGFTFDRSGNLYFFDTEVHAIRRIDANTGVVTTVVGNKQRGFGGDGGPGTQAMLFRPHNGAFDRDGALIFGDSFNNRIRRWDPATGIIETIAGTGERGSSPDGTPASQMKFTFFGGMVVDRNGDLLITGLDHRILRFDRRAGSLRVVAGTGVAGFSGDGGPVAVAQMSTPYGIALAPDGDIIFADAGNARVRRIDAATGVIRTIAGPGAWNTSARCAPPTRLAARPQPAVTIGATPGPHRVGFRMSSARDQSRQCREHGSDAVRFDGLPLTVAYWYPEGSSVGTFPVVVGTGAPAPNAALAEHLASHGYVVALVQPTMDYQLSPAQRRDAHARDIAFALRHAGSLPFADTTHAATWGFGESATPALLAAIQAPGVDAVVSIEGTTFDAGRSAERAETLLADPGALRVPLLLVQRANGHPVTGERGAFEALRYSARTRVVVPEAAVRDGDRAGSSAARNASGNARSARAAGQRADGVTAEYVRQFLRAHLQSDSSALAWLARTPEENDVAPGTATVTSLAAVTPAPTAAAFAAEARGLSAEAATTRFRQLHRRDPEAQLFQQNLVNAVGYQLLPVNPAVAIALFGINTELYPQSANTWDSLSEAYETTGDTVRAVELAQKTLEVVARDPSLAGAAGDALRRIASDRVRRLRPGVSSPPSTRSPATPTSTGGVAPAPRNSHAMTSAGPLGVYVLGGASTSAPRLGDTLWAWTGTNWRIMSDGGPRSRSLPGAAFDTRRGALVVYGGSGIGSGTRFGDTWEWDGTAWRERNVRTPGPRDHHAMAYDEARGKVVMFGGAEAGALVSGTWTWDGQVWARADTASSPPAVVHQAMAYDSQRQRVVMYGGIGADNQRKSDTWEWGGTRWERVATAMSPGPRSHHRLAFDEGRGVVVMFGGGDSTATETWTYDGRTWERRAVAGPVPRWSTAMAYDRARQRIVLFGGGRTARPFGALGDTWEWDGTRWEQRL